MKITKYIWLIFVIALYVLNYFWLKINIWTYTGIVLGLLLVLVVAINIIVKIKNRKGKKDDDDFIFPSKIANTMKSVDIVTQYEASILSLFCLTVGMLLFMIYIIFIVQYSWIMKLFISFNIVFGIILMGSMLVTNYQQFMSHKESTRVLGELANQFGTEIISPDKMKPGTMLTPLEVFGPPPNREPEKIEEIKKEDKEDKDYNPFKSNERRFIDN